VHDQCQRFADYERENFAKSFGEEGCLFKLGCQGPLTRADCNLRLWNSGTNACIRAGAPCIGCAAGSFAAKAGFPLLVQNEERKGKDAGSL
jgi:hydrogenase small subunit